MQKTIVQIINEIKAGSDISREQYPEALLALYSMFVRSRMAMETIASHIGNETDTHAAVRGLFGNLDLIRQEKINWLTSVPPAWLTINKTSEACIITITQYEQEAGLQKNELTGSCKKERVSIPRQCYYYYLYNNGYTLEQIAIIFRRSRPTISDGVRKVNDAIIVNDKRIIRYLNILGVSNK